MKSVLFVNVANIDVLEPMAIPLGQLSLATIIDNEIPGVNASVFDLNHFLYNNQKHYENLLDVITLCCEEILNKNPDMVSLYTMCNTLHFALLISEQLKKKKPKLPICLAGPQATATAEDLLIKYNYIDIIGVGEGENNIKSVINGVFEKNLSACRGIKYRDVDNKIISTGSSGIVYNLDELPYLNYKLLNYSIGKAIPIEVGRGCPFNCSFCSTSKFWEKTFRIKSPKRIFAEIENLVKNYGIKKFAFEHDLFVLQKDVVTELCNMIIDANLNIRWGCSSRIDTIDKRLIDKMAEAGCYAIYFGVETGSSRMQKVIKKSLNLDTIHNVIDDVQSVGIEPTISFIYGFPEETEEDIEDTLSLYYSIYLRFKKNFFKREASIQLHRLRVLAGTQIHDAMIENLYMPDDPRMDIQSRVNHWNDVDVKDLVNDKKIFPHYFHINSRVIDKYKHLDLLYGHLFRYFIEYLNCTFPLLLSAAGRHTEIYNIIMSEIAVDELYQTLPSPKKTVLDIITPAIEIFHKVITKKFNSKEYQLLADVFNFEYSIFKFLHDKSGCFGEEKYYKYDVIEYKKSDGNNIIEITNKIKMQVIDNKRTIEKVVL